MLSEPSKIFENNVPDNQPVSGGSLKPWDDEIMRNKRSSKSTSDRIYRMMRLVRELAKGDFINIDELAENIGVHRRTIQRDFKILRDAGLNIHHARGKGYVIGDDFIMAPMRFHVYETIAVMLLGQASESNLSQPLLRSSRSAFEKLSRTLTPESRDAFRRFRKRISVKTLGDAVLNIDIEIFQAFMDAMFENRKCICVYDSIADKRTIEISLDPYHLHFCQRRWYVIGYSGLHKEVRTFSLSRFNDVHMLNSQYEVPPDFSIDNYLNDAWMLIPGDGVELVELEFSAKVGRNVHEVQWHRSQQSHLMPDGRCIVKFRVNGLEEMKWWILGYGEHVKVNRPESLKQMLLQTYQNALKNLES